MKSIERVVSLLYALEEDKENLVITDDIIKQYILDNIELFVEDIKESL
jgi:hypothetical protein